MQTNSLAEDSDSFSQTLILLSNSQQSGLSTELFDICRKYGIELSPDDPLAKHINDPNIGPEEIGLIFKDGPYQLLPPNPPTSQPLNPSTPHPHNLPLSYREYGECPRVLPSREPFTASKETVKYARVHELPRPQSSAKQPPPRVRLRSESATKLRSNTQQREDRFPSIYEDILSSRELIYQHNQPVNPSSSQPLNPSSSQHLISAFDRFERSVYRLCKDRALNRRRREEIEDTQRLINAMKAEGRPRSVIAPLYSHLKELSSELEQLARSHEKLLDLYREDKEQLRKHLSKIQETKVKEESPPLKVTTNRPIVNPSAKTQTPFHKTHPSPQRVNLSTSQPLNLPQSQPADRPLEAASSSGVEDLCDRIARKYRLGPSKARPGFSPSPFSGDPVEQAIKYVKRPPRENSPEPRLPFAKVPLRPNLWSEGGSNLLDRLNL